MRALRARKFFATTTFRPAPALDRGVDTVFPVNPRELKEGDKVSDV